MREQKRQTARLIRNKDGSLSSADDNKSNQLKDLWNEQSATLEIASPSLKDDVRAMFGKAKIKKEKSAGSNKTNPRSKESKSQNNIHTINITVPSFRLPKLPKPSGLPIKYLAIGAASLSAIGIIWLIWSNDNDKPSANTGGEVAGQVQFKVTPEYAVMSPGGAGVEHLGGYALISPAGEPKVYTYTDSINSVPIKVSQQELPDSIGQDTAKLRDLASQFNATEQIQIDDRTAYVGNSLDGPQSVIFVRENILVLIASDAQITNKEWVEYLGDLRF